jgi:hypothetical protein
MVRFLLLTAVVSGMTIASGLLFGDGLALAFCHVLAALR